MAITDGQVALGILQLVALALPVFAVFTQIYFTISEESPSFIVGLFLFAGGGFLIAAGILSAHFLWSGLISPIVSLSIQMLSLGLLFIAGLLLLIYSESKRLAADSIDSLKRINKEHREISERLVEEMEERDVETVSDLRETSYDVDDSIRDGATLEELREVKDLSEDSIQKLETIPSRQSVSLDAFRQLREHPRLFLLNPFFISLVTFLLIAVLVGRFWEDNFILSPIGLVGVILLGWVFPSLLNRILPNP